MAAGSLCASDVQARIAKWDEDLLRYSAGLVKEWMTRENARAQAVDSRATSLMVLSAAIPGALIPWAAGRTGDPDAFAVFFFVVSGLLAGASAIYCYLAMRALRGWTTLTDLDVFPRTPEGGVDTETALRFWIGAEHTLLIKFRERCERKAQDLVGAQAFLVASVATTTLAVVYMLIRGQF